MEKLRKVVYILLCVITVVVMLASVLSVFRDTPSRYLKMLDFPRIQFFWASLVTMVLFIIMTKRWRWYDYALVVGLIGGLIIHGSYLRHYTTLYPVRVPQAAEVVAEDDRISLLMANVLIDNRNAAPLLAEIRQRDPDFVLAMEVDEWWNEQLRPIEETYLYSQEQINDVGYGMTLYSKMALMDVQVNQLNNEKVPSFRARVKLANGREFILHTVHPVPPKRSQEYPDNKGKEEVAMKMVGQMIQETHLPAVVAGDLNDVVWGFTNKLTNTETDLLNDVRVGRGFYNSFDATSWWMRWPLDHVFVTQEFRLAKLERLADIGSDHFPIYVELVLPKE